MERSFMLLLIAWAVYFIVHSVSASESFKIACKRRFPRLWPRYRLIYNVFATVSLVFPLGALWFISNTELVVPRPPLVGLALNVLCFCAMAAFFWSTRGYDMGAFTGFRPLKSSAQTVSDDGAPLNVSGFNRYVRHPWYTFLLIIVWSRPLDVGWLISALAITAYVGIGIRFEERKLVSVYGGRYLKYQREVNALVPTPGKVLSPARALQLESAQ